MTKKYLAIRNAGVIDVRAFTLLGVSSSRGDESKIGQFGSGSKHGILIALRNGITTVISSGDKLIVPFTEDTIINNKLYQQVGFIIKSSNGEKITERSSMTLDFGELDWNSTYMMIREFISNALDASDGEWDSIQVFLTEKIEPCSDCTTVYIEATAEVKKVYSSIDRYFLHTSKKHREPILVKDSPSVVKLYRKGVFVNEMKEKSLFDYNGDDSMKIDEARNLDGYNLVYTCAQIFNHADEKVKAARMADIISAGVNGNQYFEHLFSSYSISTSALEAALTKLYGKDIVVTNDNNIAEEAKKRGHRVVVFPPFMESYYQALRYSVKIKKATDVIDSTITSMEGKVEVNAPMVEKVIDWLASEGFISTSTKAFPKVYRYQSITQGNSTVLGYTDGKAIYLSQENLTNVVTILEEVIHYYKGYKDNTREFQDIALQIAGYLLTTMMD